MYYYKDDTIIFTINIAESQKKWFSETEKSMLRNRAYFINKPNLPLELRNYRRIRNNLIASYQYTGGYLMPLDSYLEVPDGYYVEVLNE